MSSLRQQTFPGISLEILPVIFSEQVAMGQATASYLKTPLHVLSISTNILTSLSFETNIYDTFPQSLPSLLVSFFAILTSLF